MICMQRPWKCTHLSKLSIECILYCTKGRLLVSIQAPEVLLQVASLSSAVIDIVLLSDLARSTSRNASNDLVLMSSLICAWPQVSQLCPGVAHPKNPKPWPISKWIANRINSHTARQNTVLSDTNALIQLLEGVEFDEDADVLLSTADVESLYTSIPIKDALTAVGERLTHLGESRAFVRTTLAAVELVLKNNFFECNGITYQQIKGLAMGTPLAPPVANLFMANLEAKHEVIMPLIYKRFLDDIFVDHIVDEHHTGQGFWIAIHAMHPNIKLTRETSAHMVDFLDLQIYREGKRLLHRVHQKALNKYLYISPRSCHPTHVIKGFVRTELIRYARNSSTELDYNKICRAFSSRLRERGFHPCFLRHTFASVEFQHYAIRSAKERPMIYKVLYTGSIASHTLRSVLQEWYETAPLDFKAVVPKPIVCHMVGKNIYNTLVRAKVPT